MVFHRRTLKKSAQGLVDQATHGVKPQGWLADRAVMPSAEGFSEHATFQQQIGETATELETQSPRIYEVHLTGSQRERLLEKDFDGILQLGERSDGDVLTVDTDSMVVGFFWADEQGAEVIVPGGELSRCLMSYNETEQPDARTLAINKVHAEVYEHKAFGVALSRVEILEPILPS